MLLCWRDSSRWDIVLVLVVVLVLECVSNILVKNFRFSSTSTTTRTKRIRLDRLHTPPLARDDTSIKKLVVCLLRP